VYNLNVHVQCMRAQHQVRMGGRPAQMNVFAGHSPERIADNEHRNVLIAGTG
jgi:hypothetical protein